MRVGRLGPALGGQIARTSDRFPPIRQSATPSWTDDARIQSMRLNNEEAIPILMEGVVGAVVPAADVIIEIDGSSHLVLS